MTDISHRALKDNADYIKFESAVSGRLSEVGDNANGEPTIWLDFNGTPREFRTTKKLCQAAASIGLGEQVVLAIADGLCLGVLQP